MKKIYKIQGLDCAHCAMEVEEYLNKDPNIAMAKCDFATMKLIVDYKDKELSIEELDQKIKSVEKDATLLDSETKNKAKFYIDICKVVLSTVFVILGYILKNEVASFVFYLVAYLMCGIMVAFNAIKGIIFKKNPFDENMLMTVATIGAFCIGEYFEACLVMILFNIGQILEEIAVSKTRTQILKTLDKRAKYVNLVTPTGIKEVLAKSIQIGEEILIKKGEIIALDGVVINGEGLIDTSSINGEFEPRSVCENQELHSGCLLIDGLITIKVTKTFENSTASKVLDLVLTSKEAKSKTDRFITKFSKIYTPIVFALAVLIILIPSIITGEWSTYLYRGLSFLVIACPCAVVISVPLTFFTGLGLAAKNGILIKGANVLENIYPCNSVVFDKTGTLTYGKYYIKSYGCEIDENDFKKYFASIESLSNHPIAKCVAQEWKDFAEIDIVSNFDESIGKGVSAQIDTRKIYIGNIEILKKMNIDTKNLPQENNIIFMAEDKKLLGFVILQDKLKEGSYQLFDYLEEKKIKRYFLSGDKKENGEQHLANLPFNKKYYSLMPEDKLEIFNQICQDSNEKTIYIGDGINDAPCLARANIGMSMGILGSDLAVEACDVVLVSDKIEKLKSALEIAKGTKRKAWFNITFAIIIKAIFIILSALGFSYMWLSVLADVGLTVLLILNSLLLIFKKIK